jgi:hypothetical protein
VFSKRFIFRFQLPCKRLNSALITALDESYQLQDLNVLDHKDKHHSPGCDFRAAWNISGLFFSVLVSGKKQRPWCQAAYPDSSDGLQLFIDTRDIKDIHRASRFCHRLLIMPLGNGHSQNEPTAIWLPIQRAKEHPNPVDLKQIQVRSTALPGGYRLDIFLPGSILTGYDPSEHPAIGFHYSLTDKECGNVYYAADPPLPADHDPSLWTTLSLV